MTSQAPKYLCNNHPSLRALYNAVKMCFTQRARAQELRNKVKSFKFSGGLMFMIWGVHYYDPGSILGRAWRSWGMAKK